MYTEIKTAEGGSAWRFGRHAFLDTRQEFDSIHPSLQRQAVLNAQYGLYEVVPGKIWQVRGFDISNTTFVRGVIDEADVKSGKVQVIAPAGFMEAAISERLPGEERGPHHHDQP
jgi:alkyl sulfatase BDS1-like metallo-beta-lactamase superfamily hydrolase